MPSRRTLPVEIGNTGPGLGVAVSRVPSLRPDIVESCVHNRPKSAVLEGTLLLSLCLIGCGDDNKPKPGRLDDGGVLQPLIYEDPLVELGRMPGSTFVEILEVRVGTGDRVYFCSGVKGLNVVDASAPESMVRTHQLVSAAGSLSYPRCQHIALAGDLLYYSNKGDEVQPSAFISAWNMNTSAAQPDEVASWSPDGLTIEGIAAQGNFLYAAVHEGGLRILELTGSGLEERGSVAGLGNAWHVAVDGDYAYVADGSSLAVVNIADPAATSIVGRVDLAGTGQSVEYDPTTERAYVATGQSGIAIVDLSDKTAPAILGVADSRGTALQVSIDGDFAVVADWNDVRVYDVSDPTQPVLRATERISSDDAFPRVLGVAARGGVIYAGEWTGFYSLRFHPERSAPDIFTNERSFEFGNVATDQQDAIAVIVGNQGTEPLVAWSVEISGPFTLDRSAAIIEPGELEVFEVLFEPTKAIQEFGILTIRSDDPDDMPLTTVVTGNRSGFGVGDASPEVAVQLLSGGTWQLSEQLGDVVVLAYFATF